LTGGAWTVGGVTGTTPNISPAQGSFFARSGAPNVASGPLAESLTGTMTSSALTLSYTSIQWLATGWSGQFGNGLSRFEILNSSLSVVATVAAPLSDSWSTKSVNLISSGLAPGESFYFRAVDGNSAAHYAWLAMDKLQFIGAAVPEPASNLLMLSGSAFLLLLRRKHQNT